MKLILGTVQFGMDYAGNKQINKKEIFKILEYAYKNKIKILDTAYAYGNSEELISNFGDKFKIITKGNVLNLNNSLKRLKRKKIYGYLIHDFGYFLHNELIWYRLKQFKKKGKIEKIGFSLYTLKEIKYLLSRNIKFDIIQVPYNIYNKKISKIFPLLKEKGIEIHVRSIFARGDLLEKKSIEKCFEFIIKNKYIDKIVIGINCLEHLKENIEIYNKLGGD